ncbi:MULTISPECIES: hypothetical protein [Priestia]|jgi:hypothetical protein|uniref:hypothetical protein n=1 Tax=Priestia TaxID=2800373 RepID=UPI000762B0F5|nr:MULTISPECIES: hypothetical protein [Priestia]KWU56527.1 hypothetical protein AWX17_26425 [Priestia megaterium]MBX9998278.1 hypothetical protein [Priestia aryabhattai]MCP1452177.1 hypothetical protein [Priestia megaterium]MDH3139250.1 hypothetical protein [Priestia megaterium]MEB2268380.1 hypothetical protein [Priestia megaterium]
MIQEVLRILDPGTPIASVLLSGTQINNVIFSSFDEARALAYFATSAGVIVVDADEIQGLQTA